MSFHKEAKDKSYKITELIWRFDNKAHIQKVVYEALLKDRRDANKKFLKMIDSRLSDCDDYIKEFGKNIKILARISLLKGIKKDLLGAEKDEQM